MTSNLPIDALAIIGKEKVEYYSVSSRDIKRFSQAISDSNPLYTNSEFANKTFYGGIIAPPLICQMFAYEDVPLEFLSSDGSPKEIDVPLPTTRVLGGSSSFEIGEPVRAGDVIKVVKKIIDIQRKSGKSGELFFVIIDYFWTNQNGDMVAHEIATYIHR